jgi:hypothetical protein
MRITDRQETTPLGAIAKGILAGLAGTAAMTAHQEIRQRISQRADQPQNGEQSSDEGKEADPWQSAPAPAQVGKRLIEGVLHRQVSVDAIPLVTQVMHWSYGSAWGGAYAVVRESVETRGRRLGPVFGLAVWAASYVQLVPLGIYQPPWSYPLSSIADELGYHLTYGAALAATYEAVSRVDRA